MSQHTEGRPPPSFPRKLCSCTWASWCSQNPQVALKGFTVCAVPAIMESPPTVAEVWASSRSAAYHSRVSGAAPHSRRRGGRGAGLVATAKGVQGAKTKVNS